MLVWGLPAPTSAPHMLLEGGLILYPTLVIAGERGVLQRSLQRGGDC
jgi:hypothetical protein